MKSSDFASSCWTSQQEPTAHVTALHLLLVSEQVEAALLGLFALLRWLRKRMSTTGATQLPEVDNLLLLPPEVRVSLQQSERLPSARTCCNYLLAASSHLVQSVSHIINPPAPPIRGTSTILKASASAMFFSSSAFLAAKYASISSCMPVRG
eukprot:762428-Hanusia_phi.AAC.2